MSDLGRDAGKARSMVGRLVRQVTRTLQARWMVLVELGRQTNDDDRLEMGLRS